MQARRFERGRPRHILSIIVAALSILLLLAQAWSFGLSAPFQTILGWYDTASQILASVLSPLLSLVVQALNHLFGIDLTVYQHWRHVFILLWLYFLSDSQANRSIGRPGFALFVLIWGGIVALTASAFADSIDPFNSVRFPAIFLPALAPFVFELGRSLIGTAFRLSTPSWDAQGRSRRYIFVYLVTTFALVPLIVGLGIILIAAQGYWSDLPDLQLDLVHLTMLFVALTLFWFIRGFLRAIADPAGQAFKDRYWNLEVYWSAGALLTRSLWPCSSSLRMQALWS